MLCAEGEPSTQYSARKRFSSRKRYLHFILVVVGISALIVQLSLLGDYSYYTPASDSVRHLFHQSLTNPDIVSISAAPRVVALLQSSSPQDPNHHITTKQLSSGAIDSIPQDAPQITESWYARNAHDYHGYEDSESCKPMHDWQLHSYQNCNNFHELDLHSMRMINKGGERIAFELIQHLEENDYNNGAPRHFVYKTTKMSKNVEIRKAEEQRVDALVLERATSSRFIPSIYGYCSLGLMMPFMPEGNMQDYIKGARLAGGSTLPPIDKLRIAIHVASGVGDMHTKAAYFHNDVCSYQYLFEDGIFKLNDFNQAGPIYVNKTSGTPCTREKYESDSYIWKGRALEEMQRLYKSKEFTPPKPEVIDVWMMGSLIFTILTDLYLFEKPELLLTRKAAAKMIAGERSPIPKEIESSSDPSYQAIMKAIDMCWTYKWQERPSAKMVSSFLFEALKEITGERDPSIRVKLPERNPNQKGTDSDFEQINCDRRADGSIRMNC